MTGNIRLCSSWGNILFTQALVDNIRLNKLSARVRPSNQDGRVFVRELVAKILADLENGSKDFPPFTQCVMNLPASALEFLDAFNRYEASAASTNDTLPLFQQRDRSVRRR
eukprot:TRINITY_DN7513_c0_g1_i5.p2 TRINITY_DN7513_c0_g1~~TRINITY_DN7513_c0_g1_i5.p2  ORF type:complete len:111 (+),score=17.61 TRINITY_DN7513_c0_g1_i5:439-771(+)